MSGQLNVSIGKQPPVLNEQEANLDTGEDNQIPSLHLGGIEPLKSSPYTNHYMG